MRLVLPRDAVVVEDLRVLELGRVGEPRRFRRPNMPGKQAFPASRASTVAANPDAATNPGPVAAYTPGVPQSFTIAHLSDLHCGDPHFVPDLMERAIAEINELKPDIVICSGDLTTFGFKEEFAQAKRYLDRIDVRVVRRRPREPRLAQRRLRPLRGADRRAELRAAQGRRHASSPSTRPSPTSTTGRSAAAATAGSRSSSREPAELRDLRAAPPSAARSRHRAASATSSTTPATRSSACSARV